MALTENDIRPDNLRQEQADRFAADIARLMRHRADFTPVACPACDEDDPVPAFQKYGLAYVTCTRCQTLYINPRPAPAHLAEYYETSENYAYWNTHIFPASEAARREKIFRPRSERLRSLCMRHGVTGGTLVEVGAGFGTFCEEITKLNFFSRVVAIEPTPGLAETCRRKGLEVLEQRVEDVTFGSDEVDVVASFEVIEHLYSPRAFIDVCRRMLRPGGLIVLSCPNGQGFDVEVLREHSDTVDAEHLNYFNPRSLPLRLERAGFTLLEVLTPGELDAELVRKKVLAGEFDLSAQPFLQRVLIDDWDRLGRPFQEFLAANRLSSHMWVVAQKAASTGEPRR